jgi:hypothetical protein
MDGCESGIFWRKLSYTVGIYSPGKAFVVYDIRRHVCRLCQHTTFPLRALKKQDLANSTIARHNTLCSQSLSSRSRLRVKQTLRDCVAGAAIFNPEDDSLALRQWIVVARSYG